MFLGISGTYHEDLERALRNVADRLEDGPRHDRRRGNKRMYRKVLS